ncbi:MAG: lytic murein transglycosylase [Deltaproteobacteria bacterium]|nr:lytic murein transglycosylase [Deltaproteobacteria bacterium]
MNILKTGVVVAAVLFSLTCLFGSAALASYTAAGTEETITKEIPNKKTEKQTSVKKKRAGKKEKTVITGSVEQRRAALQTSFRKAGISQNEIDEIFSDERIEIHYNVYASAAPKDGEKKKKKLSYFDEEFGLLKPESIETGKKLIAENKELFEKLESLYGIPANYIVAIIRVETNFKEHLGQYRVFNALYTMAMLSKRAKRVHMAGKELVTWVKMCRRTDMDPFTVKGSWAGAFGIPQFMPSSYVIFAVDEDGDGIADLYGYPDAFASVANYLRCAGWKNGNEKKMRQAVYRYNHQKAYVNAVFAYAQSVGANSEYMAYPRDVAYPVDMAYRGDTAYPGDIPLNDPAQ